MTRIPYVRRDELGSEGQRLWDGIVNTWGGLAVTANGGLAGPFNAIGRGEDPPFEAGDERAVYTVARQLGHTGRLDQETYDAAHRFLGDAGMVELVNSSQRQRGGHGFPWPPRERRTRAANS
jgi:hypothetical protein